MASESEYETLLQKYRNMEHDRKQYMDETQSLLKQQQNTISKLQDENSKLKTEMQIESRKTRTRSSAQSQLQQLQDQTDLFTQKLEVEKRNSEELSKQIKQAKAKILEQRRNMGGVNASRDTQQMVQKQIRILENRLDKALVKFNESLARNKILREQIDSLRRERVIFDGIYRKLEKDLQDKKKQMANIIELSNAAYTSRDNAHMELAQLKQAEEKEQADFDAEMQELARQLNQELKISEIQEDEYHGDLSMDDETKLKRRVTKGAWNIAKDKAVAQISVDKVQSYEEAFEKIKAATGISDIDELVNVFVTNEDTNYSLFNFVNELNSEIEKLEEQIQQLREEEAKYSQETGDDHDQHKQLLKELEERLTATDSQVEKLEIKHMEAQKTITELKVAIQNLFDRIECNKDGLSEMLGDAGVTESNMMVYLGAVEQRTNEILQMYAAIQRSKGTDAGQPPLVSILGSGPSHPIGSDKISIVPPTLDEYSSEDSDDEIKDSRPLTREELKNRTLKGIHKKEIVSKSKGNRRRAIRAG